ncbi:MAG: RNA polymerase sigma factor [Polyangiaceae bacterium]|nr:RNA polymerase sigma factor [Myxococcales bacterium]MCB9587827.1 RNA polymerase sigma factor [Polyangiaceae bacterium]MCB9608776.1 RNA polymerase sigma factor [Polyangiaceae bacterium]
MWKKTERPSRHAAEPLSATWISEAASYLKKTLRRLGVAPSDLEDAVQEALIAVHKKRDTFDATRPLKPWLFGFAVRVAANQRRKRRDELGDCAEPVAPEASSPERQALLVQARCIAEQVLGRMPAERSLVFTLHDLEGLSATEIARLVEAPTNTVYSRLRTARAEFADAVLELTAAPNQREALALSIAS